MIKDYSLGKIYKIESSQCDKIYIGSTCAPMLSHRMRTHRDDYKKYLNSGKKYVTSIELLKYDDAKIILLEKYPCNDIDELRAREGYWQRQHWNECVNKRQEGRTNKQYYQDNADKIKEQKKQYYEENVDKFKKYYKDNADKKKQYYQENFDKIKEKKKQYRQDNVDKIKEKNKQYKKDNADKLKEYMKQYRQDNADKIKQYRQVKSKCDVCGKEMLKKCIPRHKRNVHKI